MQTKKWLWVGALAAIVSGGMGFWLTNYACDHPTSWLGRCVMTGYDAAVWQAHTVRLAAETAQNLASNGADANCKAPAHAEAEPPVVVEVDLPPAMLPGHIIIGESEEPCLAETSAPMAKVKDVTSSVPVVGGFEEAEDVVMPPADEPAAKMPPCADMPQAHKPWFHAGPFTGIFPCHEECEMPQAEKIAVMPAVVPETIEVMPTVVPEGTVKPAYPKANTTEFRPGIDGGDFNFNGPF